MKKLSFILLFVCILFTNCVHFKERIFTVHSKCNDDVWSRATVEMFNYFNLNFSRSNDYILSSLDNKVIVTRKKGINKYIYSIKYYSDEGLLFLGPAYYESNYSFNVESKVKSFYRKITYRKDF